MKQARPVFRREAFMKVYLFLIISEKKEIYSCFWNSVRRKITASLPSPNYHFSGSVLDPVPKIFC